MNKQTNNTMYYILLMFLLCFLSSCNNAPLIINSESSGENTTIIINVEGAVKCPGIYEINETTLIYEILDLAGGVTSDADLSKINLVEQVKERTTIRIPYKTNNNNQSSLININTAGLSELTKLPRIGEAKAKAIINYRDEKGYFSNVEDIKNVPGIGQEIFSAIKTYIDI